MKFSANLTHKRECVRRSKDPNLDALSRVGLADTHVSAVSKVWLILDLGQSGLNPV